MQQINTSNTPSSVIASSAAMGVATRSVAGGVDVTLDTEAAAADIIVLTGLTTAPFNVNLPRATGLQPLDTASGGSGVVSGYGRRIILRMNQTGANVLTVRGVDLTNPSVPVYGVGIALPLPGAATPNFEIYTLDGLTYYQASIPAA